MIDKLCRGSSFIPSTCRTCLRHTSSLEEPGRLIVPTIRTDKPTRELRCKDMKRASEEAQG
jgi:hypothetical protein